MRTDPFKPGFEVCSFVTCQPSESFCSLASSNRPTATISISKSRGGVLKGAAEVGAAWAFVWDVRRYRASLTRALLPGWLLISPLIPFPLLFWLCAFDNYTHTQSSLKDKKESEMKKKKERKGKGGILREINPILIAF